MFMLVNLDHLQHSSSTYFEDRPSLYDGVTSDIASSAVSPPDLHSRSCRVAQIIRRQKTSLRRARSALAAFLKFGRDLRNTDGHGHEVTQGLTRQVPRASNLGSGVHVPVCDLGRSNRAFLPLSEVLRSRAAGPPLTIFRTRIKLIDGAGATVNPPALLLFRAPYGMIPVRHECRLNEVMKGWAGGDFRPVPRATPTRTLSTGSLNGGC